MTEFVVALYQKDTERFLALVSRSRGLRLVGTIESPPSSARVSYTQLAAQLDGKSSDEGLYSSLFDGGPDDCFRQYVDNDRGAAWTWVGGSRFVPAYEDASSKVYVTWRREKGRWVIDTIAAPDA